MVFGILLYLVVHKNVGMHFNANIPNKILNGNCYAMPKIGYFLVLVL